MSLDKAIKSGKEHRKELVCSMICIIKTLRNEDAQREWEEYCEYWVEPFMDDIHNDYDRLQNMMDKFCDLMSKYAVERMYVPN